MGTYSVKRLSLVLISSIFISEALIMLAFDFLPPLPLWVQSLLDATALSLLSAPFLYVYAFLPLNNKISELRRSEEELRHHRENLEELVRIRTAELNEARSAAETASHAKSDFLASMSHELRTPLNAILGFSQLCNMDSKLPEEFKGPVREIEAAGRHLLSLVNDLIDLARIKAGRLEFSLESVSVKSVIRDSFLMVEPLALKQGIKLIQENDAGETLAVRADHGRLRQVLINFLSNAIKYNSPQGRVTLLSQVNGDRVRLSVTDTGQGIAADKQQRIFAEAFDRLGKERGTVEGTGIGLIITKRIVEAMGGNIGFESIEGQGSTFWVDFPLGEAIELPAQDLDTGHASDLHVTGESAKLRLLLAEDNPVNQLLATAILKRMGYAIDVVNNGADAVTAATSGQYALVMMDCQMPEMDGFEATAAIRGVEATTGNHLPIIAMTANAMEGDRDRCLAAGMDDYIPKPIIIGRLKEVLDTWMAHPGSNP